MNQEPTFDRKLLFDLKKTTVSLTGVPIVQRGNMRFEYLHRRGSRPSRDQMAETWWADV